MPDTRRQPDRSVTILAAGSAMIGRITAPGAVHVDGAVSGTLVADGSVSVGPEGRVLGEIQASGLSVSGRVDGIVHSRGHLHVAASGLVHGHTYYRSLEIERGGVLDASAAMHEVDDLT